MSFICPCTITCITNTSVRDQCYFTDVLCCLRQTWDENINWRKILVIGNACIFYQNFHVHVFNLFAGYNKFCTVFNIYILLSHYCQYLALHAPRRQVDGNRYINIIAHPYFIHLDQLLIKYKVSVKLTNLHITVNKYWFSHH